MTVGRGARTGRAAVFAAACVLLGALGHALMSGEPVPEWALAVAFAGVGVTAWWLTGRERGPLLVTGLTVGAQAALHVFFSLSQAAVGSPAPAGSGLAQQWAQLLLCSRSAPSPAQAVQFLEAAGLGDRFSPPPAGMPGMPGMDMGMGPQQAVPPMDMASHGGGAVGMLAAHLVAALLLGLWLSAGEHAVFRFGRTLAIRLFAPLLLLLRLARPPHRPRLRPAARGTSQRLRRLLLVHAITSRGPPAGTAVV
ncbi:hypothetical protein ACIGXM_10900 [Kitasatospora sp. NPDC052896]|uniref:hypothetical protein n=1 Tax=Kitasatospora sp. NPDC052896 TaxID=3364061 RepID=UPI0037C6EA05